MGWFVMFVVMDVCMCCLYVMWLLRVFWECRSFWEYSGFLNVSFRIRFGVNFRVIRGRSLRVCCFWFFGYFFLSVGFYSVDLGFVWKGESFLLFGFLFSFGVRVGCGGSYYCGGEGWEFFEERLGFELVAFLKKFFRFGFVCGSN